jgi:uncharacterized protein
MKSVAEDVLPEIVRRLVAEFDPEQILLFGSRAWGVPGRVPGPDSDYDVIVSTQERFIRFSRVPASLEAQILKKGIVLYGRGEARTDSQLASEGVA